MQTDIEIAQKAKLKKIIDVAASIGLKEEDLELYGEYKAKLKFDAIQRLKDNPEGQLILVSAITPTPAGEGKTTTSIGLTMALNKIGKRSIVAIREPSLGPVFGIKGGAAGGGFSQVLPMEDINLHFTGDMHAVTAANNNLAALIDNSIYNGNPFQINPRTVSWKRVMDVNDRSLRNVVIGLGGKTQGVPREDGFDISPASEIMAILCLANNLEELKKKIGEITVAFTYGNEPVKVKDMGFQGAITALLKDALKPNLVQTIENTPAFVHGGPFANIAQGTNSILATKTALKLADFVITEAGFGFDLGAEKFFDIVCPYGKFCTSAVVLVATARAVKHHGGVKVKDLDEPNSEAVKKGLENLGKHLENIRKFGMKSIVAINKFHTDSDEELKLLEDYALENGFGASIVDYWGKGGDGGLDLARKVVDLVEGHYCQLKLLYDWNDTVENKILKVAKEIYGAEAIDFQPDAKKDLRSIKKYGYDKLPICIAKTQKSLSDNPKLLGRPKDFLVTVRRILVASGAGFLIPITGDIMRMPGLPKEPSALQIDIDDDGNIKGLF
ncbi:MAG: formate--tetrahydrofolate ligase [Candidatus Cloacimonetes bacterium]|nr:formate--tetrahydrofolate ligase [Candidatus Cloacimonadota bacterium]MCF7813019.1 formate--tetrahydrofolate ligase [Candidatus Cloacimonadota bacterium]MCF7867249.1 formate--tetrahydrofolate ligase [Candidatus Cloacimonadota bacterium]MCF7882693.1 formate--tetrahydrofolate ligase [Candidatus Cloacimonadota bacterium]